MRHLPGARVMQRVPLLGSQRLLYYGDLLRELVVRDIKLRYKRSVLGMAWSLLSPLAQLLVYVFVFQVGLRLNMPNYPTFVFIGVLAYGWFQTGLGSATAAVTENRALIKRPGFPVPLLPAVPITTALIHFLLGLPVLLIFILVSGGRLNGTFLILPLVIMLEFLLILGLGFLTSTFQVTYRDTQHLLSVFLMLFFFLTPVVYDASRIPPPYQLIFLFNPMAHLIAAYRAILLEASLPDFRSMLILGVFVSALAWLGHMVYVRASHRFPEEL
jgi:lipopolysaccharide transport system permease protein